MIGKILGNRYRIEERIGGGGMALVFRAHDMQLDRDVAVKILRGQFGSDDDFVRRFRREAQNAASLAHPNVVRTFDVDEEDDIHYIVMELIRGKTLKALIQEQGPLPVNEAMRIGIEIADALAHAHAAHIVHRDIKPHNILIGTDGRVKVADFGIARATTTDTVTHTGSIMGSAHYFSPEQANGEPTGAKSDVYSLGVVLYEMVTGTLPFQGESPITVALKHLRERVGPPSMLNSEVPVELDEIILEAMEKEPDDRFDSATEMRTALAHVLQLHEAGKTHANTDEFPTMDLRATRIRKAKSRAERKAEDEARRERRRNLIWILVTLLVVAGGLGTAAWGIMRFLDVPEVDVPPIVGKHITEAERLLRGAKLSPKIVAERYSDLEFNYVISADPEPGKRVKEGATIDVVVSKGAELVELPDVRGESLDNADALLQSSKFKVGKVDQKASSEPEGTVIAMAPAAKTLHKTGATVDLTVSTGPLRVPHLLGRSVEEATGALTQAELSVGTISRRPDAAAKDTVVATTPAEGAQVTPGQRVDLVLSLGPELMGTTFAKDLTVPGPSTQTVHFQVILVDLVQDPPAQTRLLVDEQMAGGKVVRVSDKFYGQAYLVVLVDDVERVRINLP